MSKAEVSLEDLRQTNVLLDEIENWRDIGSCAAAGSKGECGIVCGRDIKLADGRKTRESVSLVGSVDPDVLETACGCFDCKRNEGVGLIVRRHLEDMSAEVIAFLKDLLPVKIVEDQPAGAAPQPAPVEMTQEQAAAEL